MHPAYCRRSPNCCAPGLRRLVLDLRQLEFIDSNGIALTLQLDGLARERGFGFAIVRGAPGVRRVFDIAGLAQALTFVDDPTELAPLSDNRRD